MTPQPVDNLTLAFPADVTRLLPPYDAIPDEFKHRGNKWNDLVSRWFFSGLPYGTEFKPKEGINKTAALRHVTACMRSFQPKHEHKEAGCAYLLSQWFEDVIAPPAEKAQVVE